MSLGKAWITRGAPLKKYKSSQTQKQYWFNISSPLKNLFKKGQTMTITIDSEQQEMWIPTIKTKSQYVSSPLDTNNIS